jgi:Domain of unknown function (DUF4288)
MANSDSGWYSVRCVFRARAGQQTAFTDLATGESAYEERITLWSAESADDAIEQAEADARRHEAQRDVEYLGMAQSYRLEDEPGDGAEIFSMTRKSTLESDPYLDTFFDTGDEYEQPDS